MILEQKIYSSRASKNEDEQGMRKGAGGVKEDTSRFSVAIYCLVLPSRRRSRPRFIYAQACFMAPFDMGWALNMREETACGTNFFFPAMTRRYHVVTP